METRISDLIKALEVIKETEGDLAVGANSKDVGIIKAEPDQILHIVSSRERRGGFQDHDNMSIADEWREMPKQLAVGFPA